MQVVQGERISHARSRSVLVIGHKVAAFLTHNHSKAAACIAAHDRIAVLRLSSRVGYELLRPCLRLRFVQEKRDSWDRIFGTAWLR